MSLSSENIINKIKYLIEGTDGDLILSKDKNNNISAFYIDKGKKKKVFVNDEGGLDNTKNFDWSEEQANEIDNAIYRFYNAKSKKQIVNILIVDEIGKHADYYLKSLGFGNASRLRVGGADWSGKYAWDLGNDMYIWVSDEDQIQLIFKKEDDDKGTGVIELAYANDYKSFKKLVLVAKKNRRKADKIPDDKWEWY